MPYPRPPLGETRGPPARAGRLGLPVNFAIIGGEGRRFAELVGYYRQARQEAGHEGPGRVTVSGPGFLADEDGAARDFLYPYFAANMAQIAAERGFAPPSRISYESQSAKHGAFFIGDPEYVAEKIVTLHQYLGHDRHILQMDYSGVPQRESLRAIELLGTRVKPLVDAELGASSGAAE